MNMNKYIRSMKHNERVAYAYRIPSLMLKSKTRKLTNPQIKDAIWEVKRFGHKLVINITIEFNCDKKIMTLLKKYDRLIENPEVKLNIKLIRTNERD